MLSIKCNLGIVIKTRDLGQRWKKEWFGLWFCEQYKSWLSFRVNYHNAVILIVTSTQECNSHSRHPEWNSLEGDVFGRQCNAQLGFMCCCVNQVARRLQITKS